MNNLKILKNINAPGMNTGCIFNFYILRIKPLKKKYLLVAISVIIASCTELNPVDIYNKVTEPYRAKEFDNNQTATDTSILIKIIDLETAKPLINVNIRLTLPNYDTMNVVSDKFGWANFLTPKVTEGNYTVNCVVFKKDKSYIINENRYIYRKENFPIIIYSSARK